MAFHGTTFERPEFNRMISDIEEQKINMVITKDLSRLGRDYIKTGYYIENYFPEKGVRYVSILDGVDTFLDSTNNDVTPFKAIINDMYARDISKKIKGVLREKELKGEYLGSVAPYGYKKSSIYKNKLEVDKNVSYVVKRIFELYSEGNGFQRIATILDNEKIKPPSQYLDMKHKRTTWNPKSIRAILVNEAYCRKYSTK
jgi:site-specific DNA recombinase